SYKLKYENIEGKPITMSSIVGQQAHEEKMHLARLGWLQAKASGALGKLENAQALADRAVDLKYSVMDTRIKVYQAQLDLLEGTLDREDEKVRVQKQLMLDEYTQSITEQKDEEKSIDNLALLVQNNGGDGKLVDMIKNSRTLLEANGIAGELGQSDGWAYVSTIPERDALKAQGYEITQSGGRTYARQPSADMSNYTSNMKEYTLAQEQGYAGSYQDWVNFVKAPRTSAPSSYREWSLAGGEDGTGMNYNEWMQRNSGEGDDADIQAFEEKGAKLIEKLDNGGIDWYTAFDSLKAEFPQATSDTINSILGGGIPYNEETGEWDTKNAWGRAE
ncbi:MAG: hypothetical protein U9M89_03150, partial [Patescibacteria group bacterium]|nr:hypothetical protein [Patescibacteria group bacterium]